MKTFATLLNDYTTDTQNLTSANQSRGIELLSEQQRLLLEQYFDNERQYVTTTVGAMNLTLSGTLASSVLSATLTGTWNYPNGSQRVTFTNAGGTTATLTGNAVLGAVSGTLSSNWTGPTGLQSVTFGNANNDVRDVSFTNGSAAISWTIPLSQATTSTTITTNATSQTISCIFTNGSATIAWTTPLIYSITTTAISTLGFQAYLLPPQISKITDSTISVGQLRFVPAPVQTRADWDRLNFLPYSSDIPNYFFIYNGYLEFWPLPSTTGNVIAFNYKTKVPDFNKAFLFSDNAGTAYVAGQTVFDYQAGAITTATVGSTSITGTSTNWNTTGKFPLNVDITSYNLYLSINPPYGDGLWYLIRQFNSDTTLTLVNPIQGAPAISNVSHNYSIAQLPILQEDFQPVIEYKSAQFYWSTIVTNPNKYEQFDKLIKERELMLEEYAGQKQVSYDLGEQPALLNPNSYPFYPNGAS